jgi:hypothetical protein
MNIMRFFKGYKWDTVEEADLAMQQLNEYYGLPVPNGGSYFNSCSLSRIEGFYFLDEDEMLIPVLGEPIEITI